MPFLAMYLSSGRQLSIAAAGLIASLYGAGSMVASTMGGVLADRLGRRRVLLISLLGGPPLMLALGLSRSILAIALLTPVVGAIYELYRPAVQAMVADLVAPADRLRAYGYLYWAVNFGAAVAPVIGGLLARRSFFWLFAADAATTFAYGLVVWWAIVETRPVRAESEPAGAPRGLARVFDDRLFLALCGLTFVLALLFHQGWTTLSLDMVRKAIPPSTFGKVIAVNGVCIILVQPFVQEFLGRRDRGRVLAVSAALVGVGLLFYALADRAWLYGLGVGIWTLGEIASTPVKSALVADLAPPDLRGRYHGLLGATFGVAALIAPMLGAFVLGAAGEVLWWSCFVAGLALAVAYLVFGRALRRSLDAGQRAHAVEPARAVVT